jgi:hypothetical protein
LFGHEHHFTVGTAILIHSALSTSDRRLSANGVVLAAAGTSRSGLSLPTNLVRDLREEAQAIAQRGVGERVKDVVANQCLLEQVADDMELGDFCDELDMIEIVFSLEEIYEATIAGLDDWDSLGSSDVATVGDLIAVVRPQLT